MAEPEIISAVVNVGQPENRYLRRQQEAERHGLAEWALRAGHSGWALVRGGGLKVTNRVFDALERQSVVGPRWVLLQPGGASADPGDRGRTLAEAVVGEAQLLLHDGAHAPSHPVLSRPPGHRGDRGALAQRTPRGRDGAVQHPGRQRHRRLGDAAGSLAGEPAAARAGSAVRRTGAGTGARSRQPGRRAQRPADGAGGGSGAPAQQPGGAADDCPGPGRSGGPPEEPGPAAGGAAGIVVPAGRRGEPGRADRGELTAATRRASAGVGAAGRRI